MRIFGNVNCVYFFEELEVIGMDTVLPTSSHKFILFDGYVGEPAFKGKEEDQQYISTGRNIPMSNVLGRDSLCFFKSSPVLSKYALDKPPLEKILGVCWERKCKSNYASKHPLVQCRKSLHLFLWVNRCTCSGISTTPRPTNILQCFSPLSKNKMIIHKPFFYF